MKKPRIEISPAFAIGIGLVIALDPAELWLQFILAVFSHEMGHLLCLYAMKVSVQRICIGLTGTSMETEPLSARQEGLCAAAGPAINVVLTLLFLRRNVPFSSLNILLAAYNFLPVFPLDGGRVIRVLFPEAAETVFACGTALLLTGGCIWTAVLHRGLWPLLLLTVLLAKITVQRLQEQKLIANRASSVYNIQR